MFSTPGVKMDLEDLEYSDPEQTISSVLKSEVVRRPEERKDQRVCQFSDEVE